MGETWLCANHALMGGRRPWGSTDEAARAVPVGAVGYYRERFLSCRINARASMSSRSASARPT